ncbi:MAG: ATP-dependent zinc metalloprotease FtsH [Planctomycetaceae bacterium]|nr:ATP-dependent zinc metalloprotease FtsH [Planctomycetaceae bacterium]
MSDEGQESNGGRRDRNGSGANRNLIWYLLATGVVAMLLMSVLENNGQVELRYMDLVKLIEQGEPSTHPKATIDVRETIAGKDEVVRYSKLDKIKIGPHEITGTVARQVVSPGTEFGKLEPNVEFHTPRVGLENDNNELFNLLKKNGFQDVSAERAPSGWKSLMPMFLLTAMLIVIFFVMMRRLGGAGSAMAFGRSRGKLIAQEDVGVTFNDVAGIDEAVDELREVVDFLRTPEKYQVLGGHIPKGVLLVGPPGTGKTLLAKAIAGEAGVPFFSLSGSDFVEMFVGVGAARVRDMFQQAQTKSPCIVFIDELDALGKTRGSSVVGGHDEREQTLNALLVEMDGFSSNSGVIVIAATNRPETLDPALLRPGRFDRHVSVDRPDVKGREQILKVHIGKVKLDESVDLKEVARITPGFVGADLANLVNEAALLAARRNKPAVTMQEFNEGVERVVAGLEKRQRVMNPEEKQRTAYHESGHALVAYSLPNADPVHKVSIIPRGPTALGYTMFRPEGDRYTTTQSELESRIQSLLAGTVAEEMIFSDVATGAQNDLERATEIARSMVMEFGMSRLGRINFRERSRSLYLAGGDDLYERNYSEQTAREIDLEIKRILEESLEKVRHVLATRRTALVALAERLVEKESIDMAELRTIIEENSPSAMLSPGTAGAVARRKDEEPPTSINLKAVEGGS